MLRLSDYITNHKQGLAVNPSRWTDIQHDRAAKRGTQLHNSEADMATAFESAGFEGEDGTELGREIFASLYEEQVATSAKPQPWASSALDIAQSIPEFDEMLAYTKGDRDMTAIGARDIMDSIRDQVVEMRQAYAEQMEEQEQEEGNDAGGEEQGEDGQGEGAGQPADGDAGEGAEGEGEGESNNSQTDPNGINEDCGDAEGEGECEEWKPSEEQAEQLRSTMRNAIKRTVSEAGELTDTLRGAGLSEAPEGDDNTDRTEMINAMRNNEKFRRLLKMAGRISQMPSAKPAKADDTGYTATGIKESGDIASVISSELALLADPTSEILFMKKIVEEKLLTVKRSGKKPLGRGDLVLLVDESGSMRGNRHDIAQAMAMATVLNMIKDGRNCTIIGYASQVGSVMEFTKHKTAMRNGKDYSFTDGLRAISSRSAAGGTSFDPAVRCGLEAIKRSPRADMIFLTDGDASVSRSTLNRLEKLKTNKGLRLTTVLVGGSISAAVKALSDTVIRVDELDIGSAAKAIGQARKKA